MATTYCITGISGYIGKLLAQKLAQEAGNHVIGIDLEVPADLAGHQAGHKDETVLTFLV